METTIANANALHRLLFQSLLPARAGGRCRDVPEEVPLPPEAADTLPMLYRSEAFAEDLFDSHPSTA